MVIALFFGVLIPGAVGAQEKTALYYCDSNSGTNLAPAALEALGFAITYADDWDDFNTKLEDGNFDLVILLNHGDTLEANDDLIAAYINGGGRVVFTSYNIYDQLVIDVAALFWAEYTGDINENDLTITDPRLAAGLPDPIQLINPHWSIYSTCMSTDSGVSLASFANDTDAVILGNDGRTAILGFLADTLDEEYGQQFFENLFGLVTSLGEPEENGDEENGDEENGNEENGDEENGDLDEGDDETGDVEERVEEKEKPSPTLPRTSGALPGLAALGLMSTAVGLLTWNKRK